MKGPLFSIQVHCKLEFGGGCHGGLPMNEEELAPSTGLVSVTNSPYVSRVATLAVGIP